jgi:hypothetical protein
MKMTGKLRALDSGGTEVVSESEITVVGILAQMGSRVITEVSNIMFGEFTKNFQARLKEASGDPAAPAAAAEVAPIKATSLAWRATKGLFRGKSESDS